MTSEEVAFKRIPITFRATPEFVKWLDAYQGIHKLDDRTAALHKMREELIELTQKTQIEPNTTQSSADTSVPKKWQDHYEKTWAKERARTDALVDREERLSKVKIERKQVLSSFSAYRGPKIASFVLGDRACPRGWNLSKCASEPCDRRSECRAKGILPEPLERGNTWDF